VNCEEAGKEGGEEERRRGGKGEVAREKALAVFFCNFLGILCDDEVTARKICVGGN
jgi:hypothetical protein